MIDTFRQNQLVKNSAISIIGAATAGLFNYLFHALVARRLSIGQYGELQSLIAFFTIATVATTAMQYFAVTYSSVFAMHNDRAATAQFKSWIIARLWRVLLPMVVLLLALTWPLQHYLHLASVMGLLAMDGAIVLSLITMIYSGTLGGWKRFGSVAAITSVSSIMKFVVALIIAWHFPQAKVVALSFAAGSIAGWIFGSLLCRRIFNRSAAGQPWQDYHPTDQLWQRLWYVTSFSFLILLIGNIDVLVVRNVASAQLAGYYGAVNVLASIILFLNASVISVLLPDAVAEAHQGRVISKQVLGSAYLILFGIGLGGTFAYLFFPKLIISLLFGPIYLPLAHDLWWYGLVPFSLSLLLLEATIAYARRSVWVYSLIVVVLIMAGGISWYHYSIRQLAVVLLLAFSVGYVSLLTNNLMNRI